MVRLLLFDEEVAKLAGCQRQGGDALRAEMA